MNAKNPDPANTADRELVFTRVFDASRELVWKAWTETDRLQHWWGPKGFAIEVAKLDFRPGGVFHYCMRSTGGQEMWGKFVYREIVAPERIVWINSFSDPQGGITRHPGSQTWPLRMLTSATFAEDANRTILTLRVVAHEANDEERRTFADGFKSMTMGFGGTFDQLAAYLAMA